ncbi:MAG TPA: hypothetical protein VKE74_29600, partial [Gemmataceae bacterium]|nr:hypothetical protein [Gemmataceae bacterium]
GAKDPKLKKGDVRAWLGLNTLGLALVFVDEAFFTQEENLAIGEGALLLCSVRVYSADYDPAYAAYTGPLPLGVQFSMSPSDLAAKFGKPEWANARLQLERWTIDGVWYTAKYNETLDRILTFLMAIPDPQ